MARPFCLALVRWHLYRCSPINNRWNYSYSLHYIPWHVSLVSNLICLCTPTSTQDPSSPVKKTYACQKPPPPLLRPRQNNTVWVATKNMTHITHSVIKRNSALRGQNGTPISSIWLHNALSSVQGSDVDWTMFLSWWVACHSLKLSEFH
jgi:hypothetical protein